VVPEKVLSTLGVVVMSAVPHAHETKSPTRSYSTIEHLGDDVFGRHLSLGGFGVETLGQLLRNLKMQIGHDSTVPPGREPTTADFGRMGCGVDLAEFG
jgi:hypothetical protein